MRLLLWLPQEQPPSRPGARALQSPSRQRRPRRANSAPPGWPSRPVRPDAYRGEALPLGAALARAASFTLLNPYVYLDTVLLVSAVGASQPPGGQPAFVAGAGLASALWFAALGYGARLLAPLFVRPAAWRVLDALVGATMLAIAAGLAANGIG